MGIEPDIVKLVEMSQKGDRDAFGEIIRLYQNPVTNWLRRKVLNDEDVRDIVQESFTKAYTHLQSYDARFKFSTWLYNIVGNTATDYLRKKKSTTSMEELSMATEIAVKQSPSGSPDETVQAAEQHHFVTQAIRSLPFQYREVIVMRHLQGLNTVKIAKILKTPEPTIRIRLFRAREQLRQTLIPLMRGDE